MTRKPANLQYGPDDVPPTSVTSGNALQYVAVLSGFLVYPLIMAREARAPHEVIDSVMSWSMIMLAFGTAIQALPRGYIGSGFLAPSTMSAVFIGPSLEAVHIGGLALLAGMTMVSGVVESLMSRSLHRVRALLPPELAGVVLLLVALSSGVVGYKYLFADTPTEPADLYHWIVALVTLVVTIVLSVWGRGILRTSCVLIGMVIGCIVAIATGVLPSEQLHLLATLPVLQVPRVGYFSWSFDVVMVGPFVIAALANTLKAAALLTAAERVTDADWVRPDLSRIGRGVLADGIVTTLSGLCCVYGVNVSASSVGMSEASGVASRRAAYMLSAMFVVMAFIPDAAQFFILMPNAVVGAILLFTSCAIVKGGIETIASRMLDSRRTLVVGLAVVTGIAVEVYPLNFHGASPMIQSVVGSSLVLGTVVGFVLNALFRMGTRQRAALVIDPQMIDYEAIHSFMEGRGGLWGARRDVITRATYAAQQLIEVIADNCEPRGPVALSGSFNEFDLVVEARYSGNLLELPERRPTPDEVRDHEDGVRLLAGFLLRHNADRSSASRRGDSCVVQFQFHH